MLDKRIQSRIAIENDDKLYNVEDVLKIGEALSIPVVFDNPHNEVLQASSEKNSMYWINRCKRTWREKDGVQKNTLFPAGP